MSSDSRALKIAISSHSGCGNTTATNNVGTTLGLEVVNYTFRDLAQDLDLPFEEIQQQAAKSRIYDFLTDLKLMRASLRPVSLLDPGWPVGLSTLTCEFGCTHRWRLEPKESFSESQTSTPAMSPFFIERCSAMSRTGNDTLKSTVSTSMIATISISSLIPKNLPPNRSPA